MWRTVLKIAWPYIVVLGLCIIIHSLCNRVDKYRYQAHMLEQSISNLNQEIKQTKIKLNDSVEVYQAEINNLYVTQGNLKAKYSRLLAASKIKAKDVESVTEIATIIRSADTVVAEVDSFGGLRAQLIDPFVCIDVNVFSDRNTIINYEVKDSLTVINVQKKHSWLFGLIKWTELKSTRVFSSNPKSSIAGLQTIEVFE